MSRRYCAKAAANCVRRLFCPKMIIFGIRKIHYSKNILMKITRKIYWQHAMRGGTVIGLAMIIIAILRDLMPASMFTTIIFGLLNVCVLGYLMYYFTRQISRLADPQEGFAYGKCIVFSLAMMLFTGFLMGVYNYTMMNVISPELVDQSMEAAMGMMEKMVPYSETDAMYDALEMSRSIFKNPVFVIFSAIWGQLIYGVIVSLVTSALAKKDPDIFAENTEEDDD